MKKILFALAISGSVLMASQNSETLQNEDAKFLFGNQQAEVQLLSQTEMSETMAQGWFSAFVVSVAYVTYVYYNPFSWSDLGGASTTIKLAYNSKLP